VAGDRVRGRGQPALRRLRNHLAAAPRARRRFSAVASAGAIQGALFAWDYGRWPAIRAQRRRAEPLPAARASGYVPRRFISAEPLLEHGIALALAYVDAMSMAARLDQGKQKPTP